MKLFRNLPASLLSLFLAGCSTTTVTHHGDATLYHERGYPFALVSPLKFPDVPVGRVGSVRYHVTDLPKAIYPFSLQPPGFAYGTGLTDDASTQPWRNCRVRMTFTTPSGKPFFSKIFIFHDWNDIPILRSRNSDGMLGGHFRELPTHLSYDLTIDVIKPSRRPSDKLHIRASTVFPDASLF